MLSPLAALPSSTSSDIAWLDTVVLDEGGQISVELGPTWELVPCADEGGQISVVLGPTWELVPCYEDGHISVKLSQAGGLFRLAETTETAFSPDFVIVVLPCCNN